MKKIKYRPIKLHLSLPEEVAEWIEYQVDSNPYCATRQDFIVGKLIEIMRKENPQGALGLS